LVPPSSGSPISLQGTKERRGAFTSRQHQLRRNQMRGLLLWLIGIPLPIIILLYLFDVI
jgi:hypothetical protein